MALTFYYGSGSPFAWRVWLALEHKKVPYELKVLSFDRGDTKAPSFRAINPRGKVPTIVHDGFNLWESLAILEYLEERFPEPPLLPKDPKARATARRLIIEADGDLAAAGRQLFEATLFAKEPVEPAKLAEIHDGVVEQLQRLEADLSGDYFTGALSLADFTIFPHLRLLGRVEDRQPGKGIGNRMPAKLAAWMKRIEALPYYQKTLPPHWKS
jgi:glutathione S-transferase